MSIVEKEINLEPIDDEIEEFMKKADYNYNQFNQMVIDEQIKKMSTQYGVPLKATIDENIVNIAVNIEDFFKSSKTMLNTPKSASENLTELPQGRQAELNQEIAKHMTSQMVEGKNGGEVELKSKGYYDKYGRLTTILYVEDEGYQRGITRADDRAEKDYQKQLADRK